MNKFMKHSKRMSIDTSRRSLSRTLPVTMPKHLLSDFVITSDIRFVETNNTRKFRFATILPLSMGLRPSDRISMHLYTSIPAPYTVNLAELRVRLGSSVVSLSHCPVVEPQVIALHMLRVMHVCLRFIESRKFVQKVGILRTLDKARLRLFARASRRLPLADLMMNTRSFAAALGVCLPPFKFKVVYSPDVSVMADRLIKSVIYGIRSYQESVSSTLTAH